MLHRITETSVPSGRVSAAGGHVPHHREPAMTVRNLEYMLKPSSIALIGASRRPNTVGAIVARNLFSAGFDGPVMPVNPQERSIEGVLCYKSVEDLPVVPDLAVICSAAETVPALIHQLGERGTKAAIVIPS